VRLADDIPYILTANTYFISIPDWCDWQNVGDNVTFKYYEFQFQIGAIGSLAPKQVIKSFPISIPDWCDWQHDR